MAGYNRFQQKEHAFQTIGKDLKSGNIPNVLLLCGSEQYLVHWAVDQLTKKYINETCATLDFTRIEAENASIDKIKESCETLSMLSERRVVLLPEFPPATGESLKGFSSGDEEALISYFSDLPSTCLLIITGKAPDKKERKKGKNKLQTAVSKEGKVYDFGPLSGGQLKSFIAKRFRTSGKTCRDSVIDMLIADSGYGNKEIEYNLYNLENDIKKIIAHSDGQEITSSDVALTISTNLETNIFAMLDAISRNRKDEAYRLLHNLLSDGEGVYKLLALISSQLELILEVKEMLEEGLSLGKMQKALGIHEFRVKKAMGASEQYSVKRLKQILSKAYSVDGNIKTGLLDQNLALELFIAEI